MGRDLGVGVERKALHAGTAGTGERWRLARVAKPRADAPDLLTGPLPEGNTLLHGGRHGTGEFGRVIAQRVMPRGHGSIATRLQASQVAQLTDDAPTDLLDHGGDVGVGRGLDLDEARLEAGLGAIQIDSLKEDTMKMDIQIDGTAEALDKGRRSRLDLGPWDTTGDRLVHIILADRGTDDRMDLRGQLLGRGHPIPQGDRH